MSFYMFYYNINFNDFSYILRYVHVYYLNRVFPKRNATKNEKNNRTKVASLLNGILSNKNSLNMIYGVFILLRSPHMRAFIRCQLDAN